MAAKGNAAINSGREIVDAYVLYTVALNAEFDKMNGVLAAVFNYLQNCGDIAGDETDQIIESLSKSQSFLETAQKKFNSVCSQVSKMSNIPIRNAAVREMTLKEAKENMNSAAKKIKDE